MKSRRWSAPMRGPLWHGPRYCSTAWRRRSPCWGKDTTTWRSSHTLMITYTFYRWGWSVLRNLNKTVGGQKEGGLLRKLDAMFRLFAKYVSSLIMYLPPSSFFFLLELAVSVRTLRIWGPQQHQCRSLLLFWCDQESHCCIEITSRRSQQDWNEQNFRSRWIKLIFPPSFHVALISLCWRGCCLVWPLFPEAYHVFFICLLIVKEVYITQEGETKTRRESSLREEPKTREEPRTREDFLKCELLGNFLQRSLLLPGC